jgi:hypothetical protein
MNASQIRKITHIFNPGSFSCETVLSELPRFLYIAEDQFVGDSENNVSAEIFVTGLTHNTKEERDAFLRQAKNNRWPSMRKLIEAAEHRAKNEEDVKYIERLKEQERVIAAETADALERLNYAR